MITYSKNSRIIFSLVDKNKNFTQLKNQIKRIETNAKSSSNVFKAIVESVKEFKENGLNENSRYIICITNDIGGDNQQRIRKEDVQELLR